LQEILLSVRGGLIGFRDGIYESLDFLLRRFGMRCDGTYEKQN
jgi:hypothetical protein